MKKQRRMIAWTMIALFPGLQMASAEKVRAETNAPFSMSAEEAVFEEVMPGVSKSMLWEDAKTGRYGSYSKFDPGFKAGFHSHSKDILIVGIRGAYIYRDDSGERKIGAGDFIRIPAGHKHWSSADALSGALFYEEGSGKFDLKPEVEMGLAR